MRRISRNAREHQQERRNRDGQIQRPLRYEKIQHSMGKRRRISKESRCTHRQRMQLRMYVALFGNPLSNLFLSLSISGHQGLLSFLETCHILSCLPVRVRRERSSMTLFLDGLHTLVSIPLRRLSRAIPSPCTLNLPCLSGSYGGSLSYKASVSHWSFV